MLLRRRSNDDLGCDGCTVLCVHAYSHTVRACVRARADRPLAAIKTVIRDKSTKALPFAMTIATFANCTLWGSYVIGWSSEFSYVASTVGRSVGWSVAASCARVMVTSVTVLACVRASVRACVCACVRLCLRASVLVCVRVCVCEILVLCAGTAYLWCTIPTSGSATGLVRSCSFVRSFVRSIGRSVGRSLDSMRVRVRLQGVWLPLRCLSEESDGHE